MQKVISPIEFMFGGGRVKVEFKPKQIMVRFFGTLFDLTATQPALRNRVQDEIRKAGYGAHLDKVLTPKRK